METFIEALLKDANVSWTRTQYLTVIENGISSIKDKCNQSHNNALIIASNISADYTFVKNMKARGELRKRPKTPPVRVNRSIATWNNYDEMEGYLRYGGIYAGIAVTSFPDLPNGFFDDIKYMLSINDSGELKRQSQTIKDLIKKDRLEELYYFLSVPESKNSKKDNSTIRGFVSEAALYWMVYSASQKVAKNESNVFNNLRHNGGLMRYNDEKICRFGLQCELDVILHSNTKEVTKSILKSLESNEVKVYFNNFAKPFECKAFNL